MDPQDQESDRVLERRRGSARLSDAVAFQRRPLTTLARRQRANGDLFELTSLIGGRMLVVGTPELAHEVLRGATGRYLAGAANRRILPVLPENTVLTLDGDAHRERRRVLAPMLRGDSLLALTPVIRELASREIERWPVGTPYAMLPRMRRLAFRVAARLLLGIDDHTLLARLEQHLARSLHPYTMLAGIDGLRRLGPASPQAMAERCRRGFAQGLEAVLKAKEAAGREGRSPALGRLGADELFALLLAGHETTATALAWTVEELARTPEIADALAREAAVERPLLNAVIEELLRLRPPLVDIVRQPSQPVRLAGHDIQSGTLLLIPPPLIHRQAAERDPERFEPERFVGRRPDPRTWMPFGGGDRRCLGASLAMLELREVLPLILDRFQLRPAHAHPERPRLYGTALVPARGAQVVLRAR